MCVCVRTRVCVCVCERERQTERDTERERTHFSLFLFFSSVVFVAHFDALMTGVGGSHTVRNPTFEKFY